MKRCRYCQFACQDYKKLVEHLELHSRPKNFLCKHCTKTFVKRERCRLHERTCDSNPTRCVVEKKKVQYGGAVPTGKFELHESAFGGKFKNYRYNFEEYEDDWILKLNEMMTEDMNDILKEWMRVYWEEAWSAEGINHFKWYVGLSVEFQKVSDPTILTVPPPYFSTHPLASYQAQTQNDNRMEKAYEILMGKIDDYMALGSGWVLNRFIYLELHYIHIGNPLEAPADDKNSDEDNPLEALINNEDSDVDTDDEIDNDFY